MAGTYPRFVTAPAGSFFLLGIRGVGKLSAQSGGEAIGFEVQVAGGLKAACRG